VFPTSWLKAVNNPNLIPPCMGWNVYLVGPGKDGANGDVMRNLFTKEFWTRAFKACGGTVVFYDTELPVYPVQGPGAGTDGTANRR
jgi:hypothetical protein